MTGTLGLKRLATRTTPYALRKKFILVGRRNGGTPALSTEILVGRRNGGTPALRTEIFPSVCPSVRSHFFAFSVINLRTLVRCAFFGSPPSTTFAGVCTPLTNPSESEHFPDLPRSPPDLPRSRGLDAILTDGIIIRAGHLIVQPHGRSRGVGVAIVQLRVDAHVRLRCVDVLPARAFQREKEKNDTS